MSWTTTRTSADYTPAVAVWPSGRTQPCTVLAVRLDSVESARRKLESGIVAWVRKDDVSAVSLASEVARDVRE